MSDMTSTEKKRRLILFSLLGVALVVSILLASFFLFTPGKPVRHGQTGHSEDRRHQRQGGRRRLGGIQSETEGTRYATGQ